MNTIRDAESPYSNLIGIDGAISGSRALDVGYATRNNFEGSSVGSFQEWFVPDNDEPSLEESSMYVKLVHPDWTTDRFRYAMYGELEKGSPAGGSLIKLISNSRGDTVYCLNTADPSEHSESSGGIGIESALSGNGSTAFLGSLQGTSGDIAGATVDQSNCVLYSALIHDDDQDAPTQGFTGPLARGAFICENSLGAAFVARQSGYISNNTREEFRIVDSTFANTRWAARGDGATLMGCDAATSGAQNMQPQGSIYRMAYWDGSASQFYDFLVAPTMSGGSSPTPQVAFNFQQYVSGSPQTAATALVLTPTQASFQNKAVAAVGSMTMQAGGGNVDLQGGQFLNAGAVSGTASAHIQIGAHRDTVQAATPTGTTSTINWQLGNSWFLDLGSASGNVTLTFSNATQGAEYKLKVFNNGNSRTITWPANVKWPGGSAPTITTGSSSIDLIEFYYDGTDFLGKSTLNFS